MILFFIRRFNDIDHIAPIVYRMAKERKQELLVLCINCLHDISDDFRLQLLREQFDITIDYAYRYCCPTFIHKLAAILLCNSYMRQPIRQGGTIKGPRVWRKEGRVCTKVRSTVIGLPVLLITGMFKRFMYEWVIDKLAWKIFDEKWAKIMLIRSNASALVFDSAMHGGVSCYEELKAAAKDLGIPIVFVPHGMRISSMSQKQAETVCRNTREADPDFILVPHRDQLKECVEGSISLDKVRAFGVTRYCKEWMDVVENIIPFQSFEGANSRKLRVLYIARGDGAHGSASDTVRESLSKLCELDFAKVVIKPHTRSNRFEFGELYSHAYVAHDVLTSKLIEWADVVIGTLSSVLVEAQIRGKALIFPKYFMDDDRRYGYPHFADTACWQVKNYDEMEIALRQLSNDRTYRAYDQKNVDEFIREYVYNGEENADVLGKYVAFLDEVVRCRGVGRQQTGGIDRVVRR